MSHDALMAAFVAHRSQLEAWRNTAEHELRALLGQRHDVQVIASRTKSAESLRGKLARPDKTYRSLWDITDLVGLRVVTSFEDSVDEVAHALERHFVVDLAHSTDKRRAADHRQFGYRSLHYVCCAPASSSLPTAFRFEVQLRTVLQHAWAEVEHDLGYKASAAVPDVIRRRFSRVASLLELADQEFSSIRNDLARYQAEVHAEVSRADRAIDLDVVSLPALLQSPALHALDAAVAARAQRPLGSAVFFPEYLVRLLRHAGLATVDDVTRAVTQHQASAQAIVTPYLRFATEAWQLDLGEHVNRGYGLFFVAHASLLCGNDLHLNRVARLARAYADLDRLDDARAHRFASDLAQALWPALEPSTVSSG